MATNSFRAMRKAGHVKRVDANQVRLVDIHEEPGFNLRVDGEDLAASIEALADHIAGGGIYPPLEIRFRDEGGVWVVDGHRRRRALLRCLERGIPLADSSGDVWVDVKQFTGNDADRVARVITSAEGRALQPLEVAEGYRRLTAYGWSKEQIAKKVGKSVEHVRSLLLLSTANSDVQNAVRGGAISASEAIKTVKAHGEQAGAVIERASRAAGGQKVKPKMLRPEPKPRPTLEDMAAVVKGLVRAIRQIEPDHAEADRAMAYLLKHNLQGSPLRTEA